MFAKHLDSSEQASSSGLEDRHPVDVTAAAIEELNSADVQLYVAACGVHKRGSNTEERYFGTQSSRRSSRRDGRTAADF
uniref:Uncharacterized protein n=1 Tax=Ditylenchus dipsaci TaxID=166011 RepID=A0A915E3Z6_9BILA